MNEYKKKQDSTSIPGAAYIRFSSDMQSDSFSLDVPPRQIKEQAELESVEIVKVFANPAQSAYRKKDRSEINAMRVAASPSLPRTEKSWVGTVPGPTPDLQPDMFPLPGCRKQPFQITAI